MTTQHKLGQYMDGRIPIAYCKVCSAEGDKLFDECSGPIPFATNFRLLTNIMRFVLGLMLKMITNL